MSFAHILFFVFAKVKARFMLVAATGRREIPINQISFNWTGGVWRMIKKSWTRHKKTTKFEPNLIWLYFCKSCNLKITKNHFRFLQFGY